MELRDGHAKDTRVLYELFQRNEFLEEGIVEGNFMHYMDTLFYKNPLNIHYQVVGENPEGLIAHHGLVPFGFKVRGKNLVAGLGSNLVIDRPHRSLMSFLQLQRKFFGEYGKHSIDFAYGLVTRKEVLNLHLRTGFKKVGDVFVYARPYLVNKIIDRLVSSPLLRAVLKGAGKGVEGIALFPWGTKSAVPVRKVESFDNSWDFSLSSLSDAFRITAARSAQTLNWRFGELKYRDYEIYVAGGEAECAGYIVLRPMPMQGFSALAIVDILVPLERPDIAKALLGKVHERARELGVDLTAVMLAPHSPVLPLLKSCGFLKTPESFTLVVHESEKKEHRLAENFSEWHVTWLDHDFV